MLKDKIEKRIEGRYEVIQENIESLYRHLSELSASIEALQLLSFLKDDLQKENN